MLITNHVLAGALIGLAARRRPLTVAAAGAASHFALDSIPHWGPDHDERLFNRVAVVDGLVGLATIGWVARVVPRSRRLAVLAGIAGSCIPDLDKPALMFYGKSPFPAALDRFHAAIQRESAKRMRQEFGVTAVLSAAVLVISAIARR